MPALQNDTFLRALARQPTPYTPIWLMRQAGRYLPEYTATRQRAGSFLALAHSPDLATEVTLQPLQRFALDAAILFSDILTVPDAMGLGLFFAEGEGPRFRHPLRDDTAIAALVAPDMSKLRYVFDAVAQIRRALAGSVPLIGFRESPFTLACYMIEGQGNDSFSTAKKLLYSRPDLMRHLLAVTARAVTDYLNEQIRSGAQAVMVFDTWGRLVVGRRVPDVFLAYMARIMSGLIREHEGERCRGLYLPKAGANGCKALPGAAAMRSDSTGQLTSARRANR